jgi:dihydroorotase
MTLYLHPEVTPEEIRKASKAGVSGESGGRKR